MTATGILGKSSNVGTLMIAQQVGPDAFIDDGQEARSGRQDRHPAAGRDLRPASRRVTWSSSTFGNLPIGQGVSISLLQLAGMYQAIANNGVRIAPTLIASHHRRRRTRRPPPPVPHRGDEPGDRAHPAGHAARARSRAATTTTAAPRRRRAITGYQVAGKTGTAQKVDEDDQRVLARPRSPRRSPASCRPTTPSTSSRSCWTTRRATRRPGPPAAPRCSTTSPPTRCGRRRAAVRDRGADLRPLCPAVPAPALRAGAVTVILPPVAPSAVAVLAAPAGPGRRHPGEVAALTGARPGRSARPSAAPDDRLTGITLRAQDVRPGDLFAALPGSRAHGAQSPRRRSRRRGRRAHRRRRGAALAGPDAGAVAGPLAGRRPRGRCSAPSPRRSTATPASSSRSSASPAPRARPPPATCWRPRWPPTGPAPG